MNGCLPSSLRFHDLGDEHAAHGAERRVEVQPFDVATELLDTVDIAAALHLDRDDLSVRIPAHQVDRADCGRILATNQDEPCFDRVWRCRQQHLEVGLDAVFLEARVVAEHV